MELSKLPGMSRLSNAVREADVVGLVDTLDKAMNAGALEVRRRREKLRPTVVVTYRGWHADGIAHLSARCIEKPLFNAGEVTAGMGEAMKANLRRFLVLAIPDVTVRASMGEVSAEFTSDADGYLHIELPVGELSPGWHVLDIDPAEGSEVNHTTGRVLVPDPEGTIAVISDIDDTILKTGLTQRWTALGRTFLRDVADRKPVPGMSALYAGLARGTESPGRSTPFFYVSTGSWNYYDYLVAFMNLHRFPRGPLFLTDWGPKPDRLVRDGREHKRSSIRALLSANPGHDFVLIGDVGQGDPETYEVMVREFPDRIRAVFLIYVGSHLAERSDAVATRAAELREEGFPVYYVDDAAEAVTAAWQLGLVDKAATEDVTKALLDRS